MHAGIAARECAERVRGAKSIFVLSGAGMSTAAGVPDFRGPKGLYVTRAYDPEAVFEISGFDRDPRPFYRFSRDFLGLIATIEPTYTHTLLAEWEKEGRPVSIVTQNIDGLHQRAGSAEVYPMHGDYESAHCRRCGRGVSGRELVARMEEMEVPLCEACGGVIKPDIVFFGENVRWLPEAATLAEESDLMLVLGSSLTVYPAAALPLQAGGDVVVVNRGEIGLRPAENIYVADAGLDEFFREVEACLRSGT